MMKKRKAFRIYGKVVGKETGRGIPALKVKAFDKDQFFDDVLGEVTTDKDGNFEIIYDKSDFQNLFFDNKPDIYIQVKTEQGEEIYSSEDQVRYKGGETEEFIVSIPSDWSVYPTLKFEVSVLRPEDMLTLDFRFINLKHNDGKLTVINPGVAAYMVVEFPPQNIAEEAFYQSAEDDEPFIDLWKGAIRVKDSLPSDEELQTDSWKRQMFKIEPKEEIPYYPCKSRISEKSRLVFIVPEDAEIEYTTEGLLEACSKFELQVAPTATPPLMAIIPDIKVNDLQKKVNSLKLNISKTKSLKNESALTAGKDLSVHRDDASMTSVDARQWSARTNMKMYLSQEYDKEMFIEIAKFYWGGNIKPKLNKPTGLETSIEAPFRLIISPSKFAAWAHAFKPVFSPPTKRYELWHTRFATRLGKKINEEDERFRTIRAIWARDYGFNHESPDETPEKYPYNICDEHFRMSLEAFDRHNIVHLSANTHIPNFTPVPVNVKNLMLTSLGAWMNFRGAWEPPSMLSVEDWRHRSTMGRDHYVRVVYKGYLFPFGNRAALIKVTERKFHPQVSLILQATKQYFVRKMDSKVQTLKEIHQPEIRSFIKAVSENFEKEIFDLAASMEGKSRREIDLLIRESAQKFNEQTAFLVKSAGEKISEEFASLAESAKGEYQSNIDSVIKNIAARSYTNVPGNIAYLRQRKYIVVRKPERVLVNNTGLFNENNHSYDLQFPFWNIQITTLVTPDLDRPEDNDINNKGDFLFWPRVGGKDFHFHMIARDYAGNNVEFTAPLIFIDQTVLNYIDNSGNPDDDKYNKVKEDLGATRSSYISQVHPAINGQPVMYADSAEAPGKTTLETQSITFSAEIPKNVSAVATLKQNLGDQDIPPFYPIISKAKVLIPSVKHLAGINDTVEIEYEGIYLEHGLGGTYNKGEVFAKLVNGLKLDFNSQGDRSGGLVKPNMNIQGLSRLMGPVAGSNLTGIAGGTFDPQDFFGGLDAKIFGVIDLWNIIKMIMPDTFSGGNEKVPKLTTDTSSDGLKVELKWEPDLKDWNKLFIASNDNKPASLSILGQLSVKSSGEADVDINCTMKDFSIDLLGNIESFIILRFNEIIFKYSGGEKADIDVNLAKIEFTGVLAFVETLKKYIPLDGFSDPPSVDVTEKGISAGFSLGLPDLAIGIFSLENVSLGASFTIPFINDPLSVRFNFCERHSPFLLTVSCFGGGGFFAITLDPKGVQLLEAAFEFGAKISVNFGVAKGGVYVAAGIYYRMQSNPDKASLTGYFKIGGNVSVLGIISVSIELNISLMYEFSSGKCVGRATLTIEVEVLLFSICVEISCEKKFAGSDSDPTFKELMAPYVDPETEIEVDPWKEYCEAFC